MQEYQNYLMDMDGVLVRGRTPIPGAVEVIRRFNEEETPYLVLTNNPLYTPGDLAHRLQSEGLNVPADRIFTSALATARFLSSQRPTARLSSSAGSDQRHPRHRLCDHRQRSGLRGAGRDAGL